MACYAALSSLLELLDCIIHQGRYPNFLSGRQQLMESLHEKFNFLQELVQDYSGKFDEEAADCIEKRIADAAHQAQGIIELEISNQIVSKGRSNVVQKIFRTLNFVFQQSSSPPEVQVEVDQNLHKVELELDSILRELRDIKESQRTEDLQLNSYSADIGASERSPICKSTVVGFGEQVTAIKDQLCGLSPKLEIIPIVGMGGMGKTTLARNIFDDALIVGHFDCRAWGTMSQDCNVNRVLKSILKSIDLMKDELHGGEERVLKENIYKYLKGRRYLIVIDDIWSTMDWDDVKQIFPDDRNGSRVVITTRLLDVAHYADTSSSMHNMQFLDEGESWNLFRVKAFAGNHCPPELEDIGKTIINACGGLPLAVVVIAGVLSNDKTPQHWENIAKNTSSVLSRRDESISKILTLSYNHLSHQLKSCFLYMGGFPEDHELNISELIWLWIAEGFLKCADQSKSLEYVGEECIEDLVQRSLIMITQTRANGQFKFCIMHDVLRDFCRERAALENFFHVTQDPDGQLYPRGVENVRRAFLFTELWSEACENQISASVGSIHVFGSSYTSKIRWANFKLLRTLNAPEVELWFRLDRILQMFHLKYLAFTPYNRRSFNDRATHLPASISKLQNLQTLIIDAIVDLALPPEFWKMRQLRHVIIHDMTLPSRPMLRVTPLQKLEYLQTLDTVQDLRLTNETIDMIPNLRKLKLSYWKYKVTWGVLKLHCLNNLVRLACLEELEISDQLGYVESCSFALPLTLRKLTLKGCKLPWKDVTVVGSLPNLQVLRLRWDSFVGEEWKPIEGEFTRLKFLLLEDLDLKYWRAETTHFPCLEHLKIRKCNRLEEIPLEFGDIPTLKIISVWRSQLAGNSAMLILEEQQNLENDTLRVVVGS